MSRDLAVYDVSGVGTTNSFPRLTTVDTVAQELLPPKILPGKQIFYNADDTRMSRDGYISCATCHINGLNDGRTWDFTQRGEGLRNTAMLIGHAGLGQGPVHWTANFDEIQDFENDIRGAFGGTGFMSDAQFNTGTRSQPLGDQNAVYLAVDDRPGRPAWMDASWNDTGGDLLVRETSTTMRTYSVYTKTFAAGQVTLGPNATTTYTQYVVIVK